MNSKRQVNGKLGHVVQVCCKRDLSNLSERSGVIIFFCFFASLVLRTSFRSDAKCGYVMTCLGSKNLPGIAPTPLTLHAQGFKGT